MVTVSDVKRQGPWLIPLASRKTLLVGKMKKFIFIVLITSLLLFEQSWAKDITLKDNQILLIKNTTYSNKGHIQLYDNSKLIIHNSTFSFIQDYHEQYQIILHDRASFIIENNSVLTSDQRFTVAMFGTSKVTVYNSVALNESLKWKRGAIFTPNDNSIFKSNNSKLDGVGDMFSYSASTRATILIQNSTMQALHLVIPLTSLVALSNIRKGLIQDLQLLKRKTKLPYDLMISNTTIENEINIWIKDSARATLTNCDFQQVGVDQNANVSLIGSKVRQLIVVFSYRQHTLPIKFDGLKPGLNLSQILDLSGSNSLFLKLEDTDVNGWVIKILSRNSRFQINNSQLELLRPMFGNSLITMTNSDIDEIWIWDFIGKLNFNNSVIGNWADTRNYPPAANNFLIKGTVTFIKADLIWPELGNQWLNTIVRREFPIRVKYNNPANTTIKIYDPNGKLAFSGSPNQNGDIKTDELVFNASNYKRAWLIRLLRDSTIIDEQELRIASSTPITIP